MSLLRHVVIKSLLASHFSHVKGLISLVCDYAGLIFTQQEVLDLLQSISHEKLTLEHQEVLMIAAENTDRDLIFDNGLLLSVTYKALSFPLSACPALVDTLVLIVNDNNDRRFWPLIRNMLRLMCFTPEPAILCRALQGITSSLTKEKACEVATTVFEIFNQPFVMRFNSLIAVATSLARHLTEEFILENNVLRHFVHNREWHEWEIVKQLVNKVSQGKGWPRTRTATIALINMIPITTQEFGDRVVAHVRSLDTQTQSMVVDAVLDGLSRETTSAVCNTHIQLLWALLDHETLLLGVINNAHYIFKLLYKERVDALYPVLYKLVKMLEPYQMISKDIIGVTCDVFAHYKDQTSQDFNLLKCLFDKMFALEPKAFIVKVPQIAQGFSRYTPTTELVEVHEKIYEVLSGFDKRHLSYAKDLFKLLENGGADLASTNKLCAFLRKVVESMDSVSKIKLINELSQIEFDDMSRESSLLKAALKGI